jgi:hypothetical protein
MGQATQSGALITAGRQDARHEGEKYAGHRVFSNRSATSGGRGAEATVARWVTFFGEAIRPLILIAARHQGPLQQRNQRPLLVLAVGEVVTVRSTQVPVAFAQLAASD